MAKWKRTVVGNVCKGKKDEETGVVGPTYIQISKFQVPLLIEALKNNGDKDFYINLESKEAQQESFEKAVKAGKLSGEAQDAIQDRINKIPDFVRFQMVRLDKQE